MKKSLFTLAALAVLTLPFASQGLASPKTGHSYKPSFSNGSMSAPKLVSSVKIAHTNLHINYTVGKVSAGKFNTMKVANYHLTHGKKFEHGFLYKGKHHDHWTLRRWDPRYNCECFFDPCCCCWYYWCEPDFCYYPVTFCPYRTYCCWRTVVVQPVTVVGTAVPCSSCSESTDVVGTTVLPDQGTSEPPAASDEVPAIPAPVQQ